MTAFRRAFDTVADITVGRSASTVVRAVSASARLLDQLLANYEKPEDLTGENGLFKQLKKALIERALGAELT